MITERRRQEELLRAQASTCTLCSALADSRTQVVFASGGVSAELMLVGEAPGATEDRDGVPFAGSSGRLLTELLVGIGLTREEVYIANVLKCRPPDNRDPRRDEVVNCAPFLRRQLELVEPIVVVTLGNYATRALRGKDAPISTIRGKPVPAELGGHGAWLLPVFHPAAALYRRSNLALLKADFATIPGLIANGRPADPDLTPDRAVVPVDADKAAERPQLDLF